MRQPLSRDQWTWKAMIHAGACVYIGVLLGTSITLHVDIQRNAITMKHLTLSLRQSILRVHTSAWAGGPQID